MDSLQSRNQAATQGAGLTARLGLARVLRLLLLPLPVRGSDVSQAAFPHVLHGKAAAPASEFAERCEPRRKSQLAAREHDARLPPPGHFPTGTSSEEIRGS